MGLSHDLLKSSPLKSVLMHQAGPVVSGTGNRGSALISALS